jgi:hypothetical protein
MRIIEQFGTGSALVIGIFLGFWLAVGLFVGLAFAGGY